MSETISPTPWEWEEHELSEGYSCIVYAANGYKVGTDHLSRANARLIAAAPDLYAIARTIKESAVMEETSTHVAVYFDEDISAQLLRMAESALAKVSPQAQGQQNEGAES